MSLRSKMIVGIGAILILVVLVYAIIASSLQNNYRLILARHEANLIATIADRALANAMEAGEPRVVQAILRRLGEHPDVSGLRVMDAKGVIRQSTQPGEVGTVLVPRELPIAGGGLQPAWDFQERTVGVFLPVRNGPTCLRCHAKRQELLGYLNVQIPFPLVETQTAQQWTVLLFAGIAGLFASGGLIWLFFTLVVERRLDALVQAMSRVEAGDLTAHAVADDQDELGRLGATFNNMVDRLADARRQLEDRHADEIRRAENLAALGQLAAGIAHEINNPIAGMLNCVRTLLKGARDEAQRVQYLDMLREGLDRIGGIVGQLLNFARQSTPRVRPTQIAPLLQRCLVLLNHDVTAGRVSVQVTAKESLPPISADPQQLQQVFLNVLKNALEAMPDGGDLGIETALAERDGLPFVEVRVTDTGGGIPAEALPRIFDPFFTTKEVGKGTGLGLSVTYGIIQAHGGSIDVASTVGSGTTVTVFLPVAEGGE